jgi:hypothetical protein
MQSKFGRLSVKAVLSQRHFGQALESDGCGSLRALDGYTDCKAVWIAL